MSDYRFNLLPNLGEPSGPPRRPTYIQCGAIAYFLQGATVRWLDEDGLPLRARFHGEHEWRTELPVDASGIVAGHEVETFHAGRITLTTEATLDHGCLLRVWVPRCTSTVTRTSCPVCGAVEQADA